MSIPHPKYIRIDENVDVKIYIEENVEIKTSTEENVYE